MLSGAQDCCLFSGNYVSLQRVTAFSGTANTKADNTQDSTTTIIKRPI